MENELIKALKKIGFHLIRIKGNHAKLRKNKRIVIVPLHDELSKDTLLAILRQAGITKNELIELLKDD